MNCLYFWVKIMFFNKMKSDFFLNLTGKGFKIYSCIIQLTYILSCILIKHAKFVLFLP